MNAINLLKKLSDFILPKEVDFFGNLSRQSSLTQEVINTLHSIYIEKSRTIEQLNKAIKDAYDLRKKNLLELNEALITPVDKEAISRVYLNLDWIVLSVMHLNAEIDTYEIATLMNHEKLLNILKQQMGKITNSFTFLKDKKYTDVLNEVAYVIKLDDDLINEYSHHLKILFDNDSVKYILMQKEILSQLKEISKHIHVCANTVEDIVFKMS